MSSEHRPPTLPKQLVWTALIAILGFGNVHCSDADEHPDPAPGAGRASVPSGPISTPGPDPLGGSGPSSPNQPTDPNDGIIDSGGTGGTGSDGLSPTVAGNLGRGGAGFPSTGGAASNGLAGASFGDPNFGAFAGSGAGNGRPALPGTAGQGF